MLRKRPLEGAPQAALPIAEFYADESSQNRHRFLVLGALVIERAHIALATNAIQAARDANALTGRELKWGKVSKAKLPAYRAVIDAFFRLAAEEVLLFHSLRVDTSTFNHARFSGGDSEAGFNKLIYQLLLHSVGLRYAHAYRLEGYLDYRVTNQHPAELRAMLNKTMSRDYGYRESPFRSIVFRQSQTSQLIQLCDVLIGAIAFRLNGHHRRDDASPAKCELADHIMRSALALPKRGARFTLWRFRYNVREPRK